MENKLRHCNSDATNITILNSEILINLTSKFYALNFNL